MKTFRKWLVSEGKDLFGINREREAKKSDNDDFPIKPIDSGIILEAIMGHKLGDMEAFSEFHDQIQWGRNTGAIQMVISPLGSFKSIIRKLQEDLNGQKVWACKRIIPYREMLHVSREVEEVMAEEIFERVEECWRDDVEPPSGDYSALERLSVKVAERCRSKEVKPEIMVFRGVRRVKMNEHYNIHFECSGHGVEAPGSMRLEQFSIDMAYDKSSGMIRSYGYGIQSPTRQHLWQPQPSEWDENFSPNQDEKEIVEAIAAAFSTY
jgi:hypothetical protein